MTVDELNSIYENLKNSKLFEIISSYIEENGLPFEFDELEELVPSYES